MRRMLIGILSVLSVLSVAAQVEAQSFGSWIFEASKDDGGMLYAATANDSGALLGEWCFVEADSCVWLIAMNAACKEGNKYPVLANSDAGAAQLEVLCNARLESGLYRYVFTDFDAVEKIVKEGLRVGFAVPLQADQFRVVRFNLDGSSLALNMLDSVVAKLGEDAQKESQPTEKNTLDLDI